MNDDSTDGLITIPRAARMINTSASTIWRWIVQGIKTKSGDRISLRSQRRGKRRLTKACWVDAFNRQLEEDGRRESEHRARRRKKWRKTPTRREREIQAAKDRLMKQGF